MKNKKLAVIMSVYSSTDLSDFIQSIKSIFNQKKIDKFKINIYLGIDGPIKGELDNWIKVNSNFFLKIIRVKKNIGLGAMLNRLINSLDNEVYVFRCDTDDINSKLRFYIQINYLEKYKHIDVLGGSIAEFSQVKSKNKFLFNRVYPKINIKEKICFASPVAHPSVCFRKRIFDDTNIRYPEIRNNEDIAFWFLLLRQGYSISNVNKILVYMCHDSNFFKRRRFKKAIDEMRIYLNGIYHIHGISFFLIIPFIRFIFRLMPEFIVKFFYYINLRNKFSN